MVVIALAVLPALILLYYVYQQDKLQREPVKNLVKAFFYGWASVLASLLISRPSMSLGLFPTEIHSYWDAFRTAFFGAAIPEEKTTLTEEFFVTQAGAFVAPVVTIESLYAPHYRANSAARNALQVQ